MNWSNFIKNMKNLELTILGSGGAIPTPRPFCQCAVCVKAREIGEPFKRNGSSLFINGINTVIDCGEDIADSLNRRNVKQVDNIFVTHWHPDHTFGFRRILDANYDFVSGKAERSINVYVPKNVFQVLEQKFPIIDHLINVKKTGKLHFIEDGDKIAVGNITIEAVGYEGVNSSTYAYLIKKDNKKILYAPCDTIDFKRCKDFKDLDLFISECGVFVDCLGEISFEGVIERIQEIKPKRSILTHIEEDDIRSMGEDYLQRMKEKYSGVDFDFAYDGMEILI